MAKDDKINDKQAQDIQQQILDGKQQRRIRFVEEGVKTQYSGIFNVGFGADEVVFIFANPSMDPNVVRVESKIAVSLKTAKRITLAMSNLIRRYEAINGVIDVSPAKGEKKNAKEEKPIQ
jgi:hypothetical protein